jgi:hypothetical protein
MQLKPRNFTESELFPCLLIPDVARGDDNPFMPVYSTSGRRPMCYRRAELDNPDRSIAIGSLSASLRGARGRELYDPYDKSERIGVGIFNNFYRWGIATGDMYDLKRRSRVLKENGFASHDPWKCHNSLYRFEETQHELQPNLVNMPEVAVQRSYWQVDTIKNVGYKEYWRNVRKHMRPYPGSITPVQARIAHMNSVANNRFSPGIVESASEYGWRFTGGEHDNSTEAQEQRSFNALLQRKSVMGSGGWGVLNRTQWVWP